MEVASDRSFTGQVDSRTDHTQLWLRSRRAGTVILRPIRWERVVRAEVAGQTLSGDEFRRSATRPRPGQAAPTQKVADRGGSKVIRMRPNRSTEGQSTAVVRSTPASSRTGEMNRRSRGTPRVRSLAIDARVANWDGDVEVDGLIVQARPLDANEVATPVHGTLEVTLVGWRTGGRASVARPVRLGRWTVMVRAADFGPGGAKYRFGFPSVHPEYDLEWASYGAVHARLSVPGQGVFETTEGFVRIRPYSAVRDRLQHTTGQRFLPLERTGRSR